MRDSIFLNITILFIFFLGSFLSISFFYIKQQPEIEGLRQYNTAIISINKLLQYNVSLDDIEAYLKTISFMKIKDIKIKDKLQMQFESSQNPLEEDSFGARIVQVDNDVYILLQTNNGYIIYKDSINLSWTIFHSVTLIEVLILLVIYFLALKRIAPLIRLKKEIKYISLNGATKELCFKSKYDDEISDLAKSFNSAIQKIIALNQSRTLFLRSIMHELKTPIAKGRITAEMVDNEKHKDRLCSVFIRLNNLINEFAKIEELSSKSYNLSKKEFLLTDLISEVKQMLLIDEANDGVILEHNNDLIKADFDLFALSIKNLLDNAIKYSPTHEVFVISKSNDLIIKNKGEPLKLDFEEYCKPYFKDSKNPNSQGFGLGIYIIKNTLQAQGLDITYSYEDGFNLFCIKGCIIESFCTIKDKYYTPSK